MQNPQTGQIHDPRIPRPPADDDVIIIDSEEGVSEDQKYAANPVNAALRKAEILHERKMEGTPNFKSLGELKSIFQSSMIVRIYVDEDTPVDFRIKKADPVTLMMIQKSLIILLNQALGDDNPFDQDNPPSDEELMRTLDPVQMDQLMEATAKSQETKFDLILANVLEPELDREFLESAPADVIDTLYDAIAGHIQGGQEFLTTFRGDGEQPQQ